MDRRTVQGSEGRERVMNRFLKKVYALFLLLPLLIVLTACSSGPDVPFPSVDFNLEDVFTGDEIHLAGYHGQPVLLYFFASW